MSSNYNRYPRPAVVFVNSGMADIVVQREAYSDVIVGDRLPARFDLAKGVSSCASTA
jgi:diaminopimelate decarboxylase